MNQENKKILSRTEQSSGAEAMNQKIQQIETEMSRSDFWNDKQNAQKKIKELEELKLQLGGVGKYDRGDAIITIYSGAGGLDAEDFSRMLFDMYIKFAEKNNWGRRILDRNENDHGGFRYITFEINGNSSTYSTNSGQAGSEQGPYGILKNESGVHRLVRISPFNANQKRQTSFSMVEVIPKLENVSDIDIKEDEFDIGFTRSGGPGGQNVNKRETAVRITHIPTKISARADSERSQEQNKQKALEILRGKLYHLEQEKIKSEERGFSISRTTENEWGSQIRSYVMHPYKMVKDHRTKKETSNVENILNGNIEKFIEAEKGL